MIQVGERAPSFTLPDVESGDQVADPWTDGDVVLAFFKVSCPVCQMVGPKLTALAEGGARVVAVGEDPAPALVEYRSAKGQEVPTLAEADPYEVSSAYGLESVPSLFLVGADGVVRQTLVGWDREKWNELAEAAGGTPVSHDDDGLPVFRPG